MFSVFRYIISPGWALSFRVAHPRLQATVLRAALRSALRPAPEPPRLCALWPDSTEIAVRACCELEPVVRQSLFIKGAGAMSLRELYGVEGRMWNASSSSL
jgi:hypothetical protein